MPNLPGRKDCNKRGQVSHFEMNREEVHCFKYPQKYSPTGFIDSNICNNCPAGKYNIDISTSETHHDDDSDCLACPKGYTCSSGIPLPCKAGFYNDDGTGDCSPCPVGYRCAGSSDRIECGRGSYQSETEATTCFDCKAGTFQNKSAQATCQQVSDDRKTQFAYAMQI